MAVTIQVQVNPIFVIFEDTKFLPFPPFSTFRKAVAKSRREKGGAKSVEKKVEPNP